MTRESHSLLTRPADPPSLLGPAALLPGWGRARPRRARPGPRGPGCSSAGPRATCTVRPPCSGRQVPQAPSPAQNLHSSYNPTGAKLHMCKEAGLGASRGPGRGVGAFPGSGRGLLVVCTGSWCMGRCAPGGVHGVMVYGAVCTGRCARSGVHGVVCTGRCAREPLPRRESAGGVTGG